MKHPPNTSINTAATGTPTRGSSKGVDFLTNPLHLTFDQAVIRGPRSLLHRWHSFGPLTVTAFRFGW
jgi:hypothetical protein